METENEIYADNEGIVLGENDLVVVATRQFKVMGVYSDVTP
jgi:hypothetical protein